MSATGPDAAGEETFSANGLRPGSRATFTLHSTPYVLGIAIADRSGTARLTTTLPAGFVGAHTVVVQGIASDGAAVTLRQHVTIRSVGSGFAGSSGGAQLAATGVGGLPDLLGIALGLLIVGAVVLLLAGRRCRANGASPLTVVYPAPPIARQGQERRER